MMEDRLKSVSEFTTPFIDDVLVGTRAEEGEDLYEKHYLQVCRVMEVLEKDQFVGDLKKAHFFYPRSKVLWPHTGGWNQKARARKIDGD